MFSIGQTLFQYVPLIVHLDYLLFMSELFGSVNLRHFCHIKDVKNNHSFGLKILQGSLMTKNINFTFIQNSDFHKTWTKNFQRKCSWKFELKISPEITHILNWRILVCTIYRVCQRDHQGVFFTGLNFANLVEFTRLFWF